MKTREEYSKYALVLMVLIWVCVPFAFIQPAFGWWPVYVQLVLMIPWGYCIARSLGAFNTPHSWEVKRNRW